MQQPNFIFFITDQHRADHLGCYGNPIVRTPNIDAIAAHGWRANRFYVANPACMPNRATLMTGRMPSVHGVRANGIPLSLSATTFVELLREAGYKTASCGKIHLQPMTDEGPIFKAADPHGLLKPPADLSDAWCPDAPREHYEQERINRWQDDPDHDLRLPYYGFDEAHLTMMHADGAHGHYGRWLEERHPGSSKLVGPAHAHSPEQITALQAWRTAVPEDLYSTSYIGEQATAFLQRHSEQGNGQPFFMQVSFNDPHHPFTPPGKYWNMYDPADVTLPGSYAEHKDNAPPTLKHLIAERDEGRSNRDSWMLQAVSEKDVREAIALTYGSITMIDDAIGKVLQKLKQLGLDRNTVLVFTSDHGDYMGDHQLMFKGPMHYDGLIRVPFIWSDPQLEAQGRTFDALAGTIDIAGTILKRAGLAPFHGMQGRDLVALMNGDAPQREAMLIEEDNQRVFLGFDQPVRLRTLVTDRWRLSVYRGVQWGELYDLHQDPLEMDNRWNDPALSALREGLLMQMVQTMEDLADDSPLPTARA